MHELAASVLRGLARLQGRIVHEYWDPVPQRMIVARWPVIDGCYYGAFEATFLFIITAAQVDAYFHDQQLLEELWPHVLQAGFVLLVSSKHGRWWITSTPVASRHGRPLPYSTWRHYSCMAEPVSVR